MRREVNQESIMGLWHTPTNVEVQSSTFLSGFPTLGIGVPQCFFLIFFKSENNKQHPNWALFILSKIGFTFFIQISKAKVGSIVKLIIWLLTIKTWEIKYQTTSKLSMWYELGKFFSRVPTLILVTYQSKFLCKI